MSVTALVAVRIEMYRKCSSLVTGSVTALVAVRIEIHSAIPLPP